MKIASVLVVMMLLFQPTIDPEICNGQQVAKGREMVDRVLKYCEGVIERYDADGDHELNEQEISAMRRKPTNLTDFDGNGNYGLEDLYFVYSGGQRLNGSSSEPEVPIDIDLKLELFRLSPDTELPEEQSEWSKLLTDNLSRMSITTSILNGRESSFIIGQRLPLVVGKTTNRQATTRQVQTFEVGGSLKVTPVMIGDALTLRLQFEYSGIEPGQASDESGMQPIEHVQVDQTITVKPDKGTFVKLRQGAARWVLVVEANK